MKSSFSCGDRRFSLGPFIKCPHPEVIEVCGLAGFDFAVVDMEHAPLGPRDLYPLVLAAENRGLELVVRIPANEERYFKWCLDLGVRSLQVPFVQNGGDASGAMERSLFSPDGLRGLCRFVRAAGFSTRPPADYLAASNEATHVILQVEGEEGLRHIEEIVATPGLGTLFIGPYDLSQSLGRPGRVWDPEVTGAMEGVIAQCAQRGVRVGTFTDSPEGVAFWVQRGVEMIQYGSDLHLLLSAAERLRGAIEAADPEVSRHGG